ncbi:MAG: DNA polymerase [Nitrosopumilus sp.]
MEYYLDFLPQIEGAIPAKGDIPARYAFIAPSPGLQRHDAPSPFGPALSSFMSQILRGSDDSVYFTNLVKTEYSAKKKPPVRVIREHYPALLQELKLVQPKRILTFSPIVAQTLCPGFKSITEDHGTFFWNPELNTYIVPTYHPSLLRNTPSLRPILARDLERFFELPDPVKPKVFILEDIEELEELFKANSITYFDIETTGLELEAEITKLGFAFDKGEWAHVFHNPSKKDLKKLIRLQRHTGITIGGHNLLFDYSHVNFKSRMDWRPPTIDSMIVAYCMGYGKGDPEDAKDKATSAGRSLALKHMTTLLTDRPGSRAFGGPESDTYLAEDCLSVRDVLKELRIEAKKRKQKIPIAQTLFSLVPHFAMMKLEGVHVDYRSVAPVLRTTRKSVQKSARRLARFADINWNSPAQISEAFTDAGITIRDKTRSGAPSVSEGSLTKLIARGGTGGRISSRLLEYRAEVKFLAFLESYWEIITEEHPFLHPRILLTSTDTGRPSSRDPNIQQVTRTGPLKTFFTSQFEDGLIGLLDLNAIELCAAAWIHGDQKLAIALLTEDVHKTLASGLYHVPVEEVTTAQRKASKASTYGSLFLGTAGGIHEKNPDIPRKDIEEAQKKFWRTHRQLKRGFDASIHHGIARKGIMGVLGRWRDLTDMLYMEGKRSTSRKIVNTPIQQLASDILLMIFDSLIENLIYMNARTRPKFTIHDAVYLDIHPDEIELLKEAGDEAFKYVGQNKVLNQLPIWVDLPVTGELVMAKNWAEAESTNEAFNPISTTEFSSARE